MPTHSSSDMRPKTFFSSKTALIIIVIILAASAFLRFYQLAAIQEPIFDEVYFPPFANNYLTHSDFFDAHPPLGKLIIAVGIKLYGNVPFGWRVMNAVTGLLLLGTITAFAWQLTKSKRAALLALLLVAIDPMALVESRVGLINIYLALFSLLALLFFWRWWEDPKRKSSNLFWCYLFLALATAVKWIGIGALGAIVTFLIIKKLTGHKLGLKFRHFALLLIIPVLYILIFIPDFLIRSQTWKDYFIWWHQNAFGYHAHLNATHPYGSAWWTWPLVLRPIWLFYKPATDIAASGYIRGIIEIGNSVTWIFGVLVLFVTLLSFTDILRDKKKEHYLFLVLTYIALYVPWSLISRVKFIYHYFIPVIILLVLVACFMDDTLLPKKEFRWIAWSVLFFGAAFFIYFLPLLLGLPIKDSFYIHHMWLKSWI